VYGMTVLDDTHVVVVASNVQTNAYKLCLFDYSERELKMLWHVNGKGYNTRTSPVYDKTHILLASHQSVTVDMWNLQTRQLERQFTRSQPNERCKCAMLDGRVIAADGNNVIVWDAETTQVLVTRTGHTNWVNGITAHPTAPHEFVSYSDDKSFMVYDVLECCNVDRWRIGEHAQPLPLVITSSFRIRRQPTINKVQMDPIDLETNQVLLDQYRLDGCIAEGGAALLWSALDKETNGQVVLKLYKRREAFQHEVKFLALFQHAVHPPLYIYGGRASSNVWTRSTWMNFQMD
jgi:WD40 repeat protein